MKILARYTKKVGALDTVCRWRVKPWAALLISRFFSSTWARRAGPKPKIWMSFRP